MKYMKEFYLMQYKRKKDMMLIKIQQFNEEQKVILKLQTNNQELSNVLTSFQVPSLNFERLFSKNRLIDFESTNLYLLI